MAFKKKWQIDDDRDRVDQILYFVRKLLLKITSGLNNFPGYVFWLTKLKNGIKIALKPTAIKLSANPVKIYHVVYIFEKKKRCALWLNEHFFNRTVLNTIILIGEKVSSSSFLVRSQSSIEVRKNLRTNFIKLLLSDYIVYGIFVWETFVIFNRLSIK